MYLQNTLDSTRFICQIHIFIQGVFGDGDFSDLNNMIKTCACTIYIASFSHGAVNFGQYDEYAFPPFYTGISSLIDVNFFIFQILIYSHDVFTYSVSQNTEATIQRPVILLFLEVCLNLRKFIIIVWLLLRILILEHPRGFK